MNPKIWTLKEAAAFLRLSERALYELARARRLPSALIGGKWIFPAEALRRWVAAQAEAGGRPAPPAILAGSHDPLLDWAVRQSGCGLALRAGGSLDGLDALAAGHALAASLHLRDAEGGGFNEAAVRAAMPGAPLVGITWAWREQGLITPPGNPAGLTAIADLARPGLRVMGRQPRAGSHVLLVGLLSDAGVALRDIAFLPEPALAEDEVAAAVLAGAADIGFGIRAEALRAGLGFVPLIRERFDLVMHRREAFELAMQGLLAFARTPLFAERAARMGGYDVTATGRVAFNL
ncbi:helix-turn-helix transcriptional regulator [Sediminicoccus sp. KRV36]|uniref:helix-turn-helix transcriptional regulator n=1 Tax=Sediminicoccus sp. KRV36 TaxID=3133721 RepID=UPI00200F7B87|nr:helix-turn-helix transcriptional regulator [Sediminicoccus rosea]UPY37828.1 helix-turn-helix transcriptional regulator [Sediminicoccus rosea]